MKTAVILGTRPEIIKMAPIVRALEKSGTEFFILHTGQHYTYKLDKVFFEQLHLPEARYNLDVGSSTHGIQTGKILEGAERVLIEEKPDIVLVEGDTNSVFAGALCACKLGIKVGHVEAGLRSYDRSMPEEINRILADHCADYLFAPTSNARQILLGEGIPDKNIFITGNTIVDALQQNLSLAKLKTKILSELNLQPEKYFLVTLHRQENVDVRARFDSILKGLQSLTKKFNIPVVYPIHPRSRKMMSQFGLDASEINLIDPVDFLEFLVLESNAKLVLTDSGGVQEESCILNVPCVTLRDNTERMETIELGSNIIAGTTT
ncbi:MAG: UDP-N-acetylglucosamine 2-epimerase (non-hydrolyzing), partial [Chloroflexi bacterium]|nr:UDP-N-acetylglucosamine 2-epimerase (non-hydrolyzing) [Chloroflexota bacterium]